jgi:hypothetical protein
MDVRFDWGNGRSWSVSPRRATIDGFGTWRSLVAHLLWEQGVASSNLAVPTTKETVVAGFSGVSRFLIRQRAEPDGNVLETSHTLGSLARRPRPDQTGTKNLSEALTTLNRTREHQQP